MIDKIVWFIPNKKFRNSFRDFLSKKYLNEKYNVNTDIRKYKLPTGIIIDGDSEEDNKYRNIIRNILLSGKDINSLDLHNYFIENRGRGIHKPLKYFDLYERHFSKFRGKNINILEIGIQNGGSTKMWKHYFSKINSDIKVNIYGIDIDERAKQVQYEEDGITIFIGSQSDREFLRYVKSQIPKIDILIDDGGHTMEQQIVTFEEMYDHILDNGIYWCEDVGTSYWKSYGGGYLNPNSYIEYTKRLIDYLNAYSAVKSDNLEVTDFTNSTYGIHYYESIVVIEKKKYDESRFTINEVMMGKNIFQYKKFSLIFALIYQFKFR